jgi:FkbM family methyltransferase
MKHEGIGGAQVAMPVAFQRLATLISFTQIFGLAHGLRVAHSYYRARSRPFDGHRLRSFPVPGADFSIWLRPGTSDMLVYNQVFVRRDYDIRRCPQSAHLFEQYACRIANGEAPVIIDCGANIGASVIWFALAFPKALIYAVEPDAGNFCVLQKNIHDLPNVVALCAAVWDEPADLCITNPRSDPWSFQVGEKAAPGDECVAAVTVSDILRQGGHHRPFIVKVDIEGAEKQLFRSNTEWLDDTALLITEPHDWMLPWQGTFNTLLSAAARRRRDYMFIGDNLFSFLHADQAVIVSSLKAV